MGFVISLSLPLFIYVCRYLSLFIEGSLFIDFARSFFLYFVMCRLRYFFSCFVCSGMFVGPRVL